MTPHQNAIPGVEELPRTTRLSPVESGGLALAACGALGLGLGLLFERPGSELWKWLLAGIATPVALVAGACLTHLVRWAMEIVLQRDLDRDGYFGQPPTGGPTIRLLPVRAPEPTIRLAEQGEHEGYTSADLAAMVRIAYRIAPTSRAFANQVLPSGRRLTNYLTDVLPFVLMLERAGLLVGRAPRRAGDLVGDEAEALSRLGLA